MGAVQTVKDWFKKTAPNKEEQKKNPMNARTAAEVLAERKRKQQEILDATK